MGFWVAQIRFGLVSSGLCHSGAEAAAGGTSKESVLSFYPLKLGEVLEFQMSKGLEMFGGFEFGGESA